MNQYLIIHYSEIALKMGNKQFFVNALVGSVAAVLKSVEVTAPVNTLLSRLIVKLPKELDKDSEFRERVANVLMHVPGIQNFGFYYQSSSNIDALAKDMIKKIPFEEIKKNDWRNFCVRVKKVNGNFDFTSVWAEEELGARLIDGGLKLKGKMKNPDLLVYAELIQDKAYFCFNKYNGIGGLPSGTGGKVLSLISSGFDSPVASYMMMRRGANVNFLHFSGYPYSDKSEQEHVKDIVKIISKFQGGARLYIVPFGEIQKDLSINPDVPESYRVVMYRRLMFKIAERLAFKIKARALVTGENFGQVASQTLINMTAIDEATQLTVFRPLIAFDKDDIIAFSKKIGTHDISCLPCTDTCALFMPSAPTLSAKYKIIEEIEKAISVYEIVKKAKYSSVSL